MHNGNGAVTITLQTAHNGIVKIKWQPAHIGIVLQIARNEMVTLCCKLHETVSQTAHNITEQCTSWNSHTITEES